MKFFAIQPAYAAVITSMMLAATPLKAEYVYVEPSIYYTIGISSWAGGLTPSPEAGCQAISDGYTRQAGPPYQGQVQKLVQTAPTAWACYLDRRYGDGPWNHDVDPDGYIYRGNQCPPSYVFDTSQLSSDGSVHLRCRGAASLAIALTGLTETRPAVTGGTSSITLTARVTDGSNPQPGVALSFSVDVTANSGGHEHHDAARPKGILSTTQGTTDANGEVQLTFKAPEIAGIHTIKATCATCSNSPATKEIQVKVPDLLPISPNPPPNADGTFFYALTSVDKTHQGNGRYHHNQYYLTEQSRQNLLDMVGAFATEGWGTVALNDASLYWGGRYDISSNWTAPHAGHRGGREIDVSFARAGNPISTTKRKVFYDKFCKNKKVSFPFSILHHYVKTPHFHVYLEKQTACWKSEK